MSYVFSIDLLARRDRVPSAWNWFHRVVTKLKRAQTADPHESKTSSRGIRGTFKTPTTPDVTEGIRLAVQGAISASEISPDSIASVMIGTTASLRTRASFSLADLQ
jgi:hypothetical protein